MSRFHNFILISFWGPFFFHAVAQAAPSATHPIPATPSLSTAAQSSATDSVVQRFELEVSQSAAALNRNRSARRKLKSEVESLKSQADLLRREMQGQSNVLKEAQLKNLLDELKRKLESGSQLERQWLESQKDFEEKSLSLLSLYNDQIEGRVESQEPFTNPARSESVLKSLVVIARKRSELQGLIARYRTAAQPDLADQAEIPLDLKSIPALDPESLQLALSLLKDRKADLEAQMEKSILEEEELRKEIRLQEKMKEFLDEVGRMNEDGDSPAGRIRANQLEWVVSQEDRRKLRAKLQVLRQKRERDQITLLQIENYLESIQYQLKNPKKKGVMKP